MIGELPDRKAAQSRAEWFLENLGRTDALLRKMADEPSEKGSPPTQHGVLWCDLLAKSSAAMDGILFVDCRAMARAGIGPESPVAAVPPDLPSVQSVALLQQAGLSLLFSRENVLLTSAVDAALDHDCLCPSDWIRLWPSCLGPWPID